MTAGQSAVLAALRHEYRTNGGWPVPLRRIGQLAGRTSSSTLHWHLLRLQAAGLVELSPYRQGFRPTTTMDLLTRDEVRGLLGFEDEEQA